MPASATTVIPPTFDELVKNAEIIFEGEVTGIESKWQGEGDTRSIITIFTFKVLDTMKGTIPATYALEVLGGTVGKVSLNVDGAPRFVVGDRSLLFVTQNGTQFVPLVGIMHGHYEFKKDAASDRDIVVNHEGTALRSVESIGKPGISAATTAGGTKTPSAEAAPMTPAMFKEQIRSRMKDSTR